MSAKYHSAIRLSSYINAAHIIASDMPATVVQKLQRAIDEAEQQQQPVAIYHGRCTVDCGDSGHHDIEMLTMIPAGARLYTTPPQRKPLTDEDQIEIMERLGITVAGPASDAVEALIKEVEAAHGIHSVPQQAKHQEALNKFAEDSVWDTTDRSAW